MKGQAVTIAGQKLWSCGEHLHIHLREPWWGAWVKFNWDPDTPGIGIAEETLRYAVSHKLKLKLTYYKNRNFKYIITPRNFLQTAQVCGGVYMARNKTKLFVIPITSFEKQTLTTEPPPPNYEESYQARKRLKEMYQEIIKTKASAPRV